MTYEEAMEQLITQLTVSYWASVAAFEAAKSADGAPVDDVGRIGGRLASLVLDVECLADHNCTRQEMADAEVLYKGAKLAGLV